MTEEQNVLKVRVQMTEDGRPYLDIQAESKLDAECQLMRYFCAQAVKHGVEIELTEGLSEGSHGHFLIILNKQSKLT